MEKFDTVDEYISSFPESVRNELTKLREFIKALVPEAEESISYGMPGYKLKGKPLVYFAGWKEHISFYPTPNGMEAFDKDLKPYKTGKGTAQFQLDKPIPYDLIEKIVKFRVSDLEGKNKPKNK